MLRQARNAVHPRNALPARLWRSFIGDPHSSHVRRLDLGAVDRVLVGVRDVHRERAGGIAAARDEKSVLPHPELQLLAALRTLFREIGGNRQEVEQLARLEERIPALPETIERGRRSQVARELLVEFGERVLQVDLSSRLRPGAPPSARVPRFGRKSSKYGIRSSSTSEPEPSG